MLDMTTRHQLARLNAIPTYRDSDGTPTANREPAKHHRETPAQRLKYPCHLKTSPKPISPSNIG